MMAAAFAALQGRNIAPTWSASSGVNDGASDSHGSNSLKALGANMRSTQAETFGALASMICLGV